MSSPASRPLADRLNEAVRNYDTAMTLEERNEWWAKLRAVMHEVRMLEASRAAPEPSPERRGPWSAAQQLAQIYFEIASAAIGEDEVRRQRDERIRAASQPSGKPK